MTQLGFYRPFYMLRFDHLGSFQLKMCGWKGALTAGRHQVGRIFFGRGEAEREVHSRVKTAPAVVSGLIGFAVGRIIFWEPQFLRRANCTTREHAVTDIASRYREFMAIFGGTA